jgi:hypothetical protein
MSELRPLALTDQQLDAISNGARCFFPADRGRYLERVAELLAGVLIGDGTVYRAVATAQRELYRASPPEPGFAHNRRVE